MLMTVGGILERCCLFRMIEQPFSAFTPLLRSFEHPTLTFSLLYPRIYPVVRHSAVITFGR